MAAKRGRPKGSTTKKAVSPIASEITVPKGTASAPAARDLVCNALDVILENLEAGVLAMELGDLEALAGCGNTLIQASASAAAQQIEKIERLKALVAHKAPAGSAGGGAVAPAPAPANGAAAATAAA